MKHMIFGESHGPAVGVVLEDVPPGLALDLEAVERETARRAPGRDSLSTPRRKRIRWKFCPACSRARPAEHLSAR